jgi:hypothetical protein
MGMQEVYDTAQRIARLPNRNFLHVAQDSFYDMKIASILTFSPEIDPKTPYNLLILRLYGLILEG